MDRVVKFESLFRQLTPLFLLGVLLAVVFEPVLPGFAWLRSWCGETIVLRLAIVALLGYVLLLWGESLRLNALLSGLLQAFRQFEGGKAVAGPDKARARLEAARLLVAAMRSDDPDIRATSRHNLSRLAGRDLGDDADAWQRWVESLAAPGADG